MSNIDDGFGNLSIPELSDYDDLKMGFVNATRRGNIWKRSRIIYTDKVIRSTTIYTVIAVLSLNQKFVSLNKV